MMRLAAKCPNCSLLVPLVQLNSSEIPVFEPELCVILKCPNCRKESRLLASLLQVFPEATQREKSPNKP
jgi:hypothetical protein